MSIEDNIYLQKDYHPTNDDVYMSPKMLEYFKQKLINWRSELLANAHQINCSIHEGIEKNSDYIDEATSQTNFATELLPSINRDNQLITKIDDALTRISNGTYGYCKETGKHIGIARLDAWPIAEFSIEVQRTQEDDENSHKHLITKS